MSRSKGNVGERTVVITRVVRVNGPFEEEVKVHFRLGRKELTVSLAAEDFSEAKLKSAIAQRVACEFGYRRAKSLVGRRYSLEEILHEGYPMRRRGELWDLD